MEYIVLFNRPLWVKWGVGESDEKDIYYNVYGFGCEKNLLPRIDLYIEYLCGVSQWEAEGHTFEDDRYWTDKNGNSYYIFDREIVEFCKKSKKKLCVSYEVYEMGDLDLSQHCDQVSEDDFIIDQKLYEDIKEGQTKVDVRKLRKNLHKLLPII